MAESSLTDKEKSFNQQLAGELGDALGDDQGLEGMSKGARLRMEKKKKEAEDHKKRMAAMKAKKAGAAGAKSGVAARPKFDRSKLAGGFMATAKK